MAPVASRARQSSSPVRCPRSLVRRLRSWSRTPADTSRRPCPRAPASSWWARMRGASSIAHARSASRSSMKRSSCAAQEPSLKTSSAARQAPTRPTHEAVMADTINLADHALAAVQEAGYAGGATVFEAFRAWLHERGDGAPEDLDFETFQRRASEYFRLAG